MRPYHNRRPSRTDSPTRSRARSTPSGNELRERGRPMSESRVIKGSPKFSERLPASSRPVTPSAGIVGCSVELTSSRDWYGSVIFARPFEPRTAAQIQSLYSTDRTSLSARTHALACEHRERTGRVSSRSRESLPVGVPAEAASTPSRRLLGSSAPEPVDPGMHMIRSNQTHDTNDPKTTAAARGRRPADQKVPAEKERATNRTDSRALLD